MTLLSEIESSDISDIDIAYSIEKKEYYLILWSSNIIKEWWLSDETLSMVQYIPVKWKTIDELREDMNGYLWKR